MSTKLPISFAQVTEVVRQTATATRRPGYEKAVHRIQGFIAGAVTIYALELARQFIFERFFEARATAWATASLAAIVYAVIVVSIDRNEKEPWQMLLVGFFWGAVVSASIAGLLNGVWKYRIGPDLVDSGAIDGVFSIAPYTEELTKGVILYLIFRFAADEFDGALDGIIYGALVGIGFAMTENANYFLFKDRSVSVVEQMHTLQFFVRVVLKGLAGHATYTALTGLGLGLGCRMRRRWLQIVLSLFGLALAILSHALWNSDALSDVLWNSEVMRSATLVSRYLSFEEWFYAVRALLINGPFFAGVVIAMILSWRKETRVIAQYLGGELSPQDPFASPAEMCSIAGRVRVHWRMLRTGGLRAWSTSRRLQRALIGLAFLKWRQRDESVVRDRIEALRGMLG
jgi:RsiW-degrading membrane proteinase PrsW (M82 family)